MRAEQLGCSSSSDVKRLSSVCVVWCRVRNALSLRFNSSSVDRVTCFNSVRSYRELRGCSKAGLCLRAAVLLQVQLDRSAFLLFCMTLHVHALVVTSRHCKPIFSGNNRRDCRETAALTDCLATLIAFLFFSRLFACH
jgi:hypothetical protein